MLCCDNMMTLITYHNTDLQIIIVRLNCLSFSREENDLLFLLYANKTAICYGVREEFRLEVCELGNSNLHSIRFHILKTLQYMLIDYMKSHKPSLSTMVNSNRSLEKQRVIKCCNKNSSYFPHLSSQQIICKTTVI